MRVHEFVDEGLGHSSYVVDPDDWATTTGRALAVQP